ncbi:MAG: peptidylprolyl isomerase FKBP-type [Alphaproteobacteria bacterium]|nr:peptidylprolyl isomerase FKBP-type [Alphaproteobacteria bacterium]MDB5721776.1 peptidylprolyl isomerase FKBP-type [Alphaproteobacteria bacterium]
MLVYLLAFAAGLAGAPAARPPQVPAVTQMASGLRIQTLVPGSGPQPQLGDTVLVTYQGKLSDGTVFDATTQPTPLPVADLVPGFTEALLLMHKGGRYRVWIPPSLAYGAEGAGGVIPPNAELDFTIALIDIASPTAAPSSR